MSFTALIMLFAKKEIGITSTFCTSVFYANFLLNAIKGNYVVEPSKHILLNVNEGFEIARICFDLINVKGKFLEQGELICLI